jgi:hypothetical protein
MAGSVTINPLIIYASLNKSRLATLAAVALKLAAKAAEGLLILIAS